MRYDKDRAHLAGHSANHDTVLILGLGHLQRMRPPWCKCWQCNSIVLHQMGALMGARHLTPRRGALLSNVAEQQYPDPLGATERVLLSAAFITRGPTHSGRVTSPPFVDYPSKTHTRRPDFVGTAKRAPRIRQEHAQLH
jgi:hypothetical protein